MLKDRSYDTFFRRELFRDIDLAFAGLLERLAPDDPPGVFLAALLVSRAAGEGDVCIDLHHWAKQSLRLPPDDRGSIPCPGVDEWMAQMRSSELVGDCRTDRPLVLDHRGRLYLQRLFQDERFLAASICRRAMAESPPLPAISHDDAHILLDRYFHDPLDEDSPDWQKVAALVAVLKRLCIVSGAPGTGKTTTVARILGVLLEMAPPQPFRIHLCTPTGKAAARLRAALTEASRRMDCPVAVAEALKALEPCTIHRLLRVQTDERGFYYNENNRLPTDLVVVDEASMVDLVLMNRLVRAIPEEARLIILGDKDQLASVEAGAVFGDLCRDAYQTAYSSTMQKAIAKMARIKMDSSSETACQSSAMGDCLVVLERNYRFDPKMGIGAVARSINDGDVENLKRVFRETRGQSISWPTWRSRADHFKGLAAEARKGYEPYLASRGPEEALAKFGRFMILCALRLGPFGVSRLNAIVMEALQQHRLIGRSRPWFPGRPVMITRNHYPIGLYNGDTGLAWPDSAGRLKVWFEGEDGDLRAFSPQQLPQHETVFAMTVHKSQGSEFDHVLLVLPDQDTPVLTRELVYTGCTRARRQLTLVGRDDMIDLALSRTIQRTSGLVDALRMGEVTAG
jgi:exodeoxyribonuclease V alpha subunit